MTYGYFDDPNREYVITNPRTPAKWINYIGTLQFGGFVDHTGGAIICKNDPTFNRITKYVQQTPSSNFKGETLYLKIRRAEEAKAQTKRRVIKSSRHSTFPHLMPTTNTNVMLGLDTPASLARCMAFAPK